MIYPNIGKLALRDLPEENKARDGRKFKYLNFGREEEYQCDSFILWGMKWTVKGGRWMGGSCLLVMQKETLVGVSLLEAGRGGYAKTQRSPRRLMWHDEDFRQMLDENRHKIDRFDCTGCFDCILIEPID